MLVEIATSPLSILCLITMMAFYRADIPVRFKRAPAINSRYFVEADLSGLKNNFEEMREIMGGFLEGVLGCAELGMLEEARCSQ